MVDRDPQSKDEIVAAFGTLATDGLRFWSDIDAEAFVAPIGDAWSPADNVRHLIKSSRPVVTALKMPRIPLKLLFGTADAGSRTYSALVSDYHAALAAGGGAGRFAPSERERPDDPPAWKAELLETCSSTIRDLAVVTAGWADGDLDRYRLPHPLLGKLTAREMLLFTLYHFDHHARNVAKRRGVAGAVS